MVHLFLRTAGFAETITVISHDMIRVRVNYLSFMKYTENLLIKTGSSRYIADREGDDKTI